MPIPPTTPPQRVPDRESFRQQLQELPAFRALLRAVEAGFYADLPMPEPVLDLGCGDGHFASRAFTQKLQVGLDPWWSPLRHARRLEAHRWFICGEGHRLPFTAGTFGTVISNSVLEHIPEVAPVLAEVARVLRPGGWFHFCVPSPDFRRFLSIARVLDRCGLRGPAEAYRRLFDRISRHHAYFPAEEWESALYDVGLETRHWWSYFSPAALAALEWGHPLGLPSVLAKAISGRWLLVPRRWNLALTEALLRRYFEEPLPDRGAYLFFSAQKPATE